jgi:flagellar basal-body rod protein FlgB
MSDGMFTDSNYLLARKMMDYTAVRHEALASNLANVDVPGYKRLDVSSDFQTQLNKAVSSNSTNAIDSVTPRIVKDDTAVSLRADGNNVEMDKEMMEMNRNSVEYEYAVRYLNHNYQMLRTAISSQS